MLLWKQRGNKKPTKGVNLREMLSRLSRNEAESNGDTSIARQQSPAEMPPENQADARADAADGMLSQYFHSSGDNTSSQTGPSAWHAHDDEFAHETDETDRITRSFAQMQWDAARREDAPPFPVDTHQSPMPSSASRGDASAHSSQLADEIVSGIARRIAGRSYVPKSDGLKTTSDEPTGQPSTPHRYAHDFEPANTRQALNEFGPRINQAKTPDRLSRPNAIANRPIAATVMPQFSMRRILFSTIGGFGVALATIAVVVTLNRTQPSPPETYKSDGIAAAKSIIPDPAGKAEIKAGATASAPPARTAPTSATASAFVASLSSIPAPVTVGRQSVPRFRIDDISVPAGSAEIALPIGLDAGDGAVDNLRIVVADMPIGMSLNRGVRARDSSWTLRPEDLDGLRLTLPATATSAQLTVSLVGDGIQIARLNPMVSIDVPTDLKLSRGKNDTEEKARGLFEKGEIRLGSGDVIGARMFFKKAADAGDAQAANAMGATYDPNLFSSMQVRGMRPDVELARQWYRRAMDLGSKDSLDRLDKLKSR